VRLGRSGSRARVIAGRVDGLAGPVRARPTQPLLLTLALEDDQPFELPLPAGHTAFVFVGAGEAAVGRRHRDEAGPGRSGTLGILGPGNRLRLRALNRRSELLVAAGRPCTSRSCSAGRS
jgi:redox-sensitive bicupin YhaK (pirin superfamily)